MSAPGRWLRRWRSLWGGWRLRNAVLSHESVLPIVGAQLRETVRQIEEAVGQVGANFERMAGQAEDALHDASRLIGRSGDPAQMGVEPLLRTARSTLQDLLAEIVRDGEVCDRLLGRMDALEREMAQITKALADVDRISFANTILALNARIEAAHVGESGQGFEIVAQELWMQAQRSGEITEDIRATILRLSKDAQGARAEIGGMASADHARISAAQEKVREVLQVLQRKHGEMEESLSRGAARAQALAGDIQNAVVMLQFQDRVSQRVTHVIEALESMQAALAGPLTAGGAEQPGPEADGAGRLASAYTMDGERAVHAAALGSDAAGAQTGDIELF